MSSLTDTLKEARRDLRNGWLDESAEAITRAIGMAELLEGGLVERLAQEFKASSVADRFTASDGPRLDDAIKAILTAHPAWPTSKAVFRALQKGGFKPMPAKDTVRKRLSAIRGRKATKSGAKAGVPHSVPESGTLAPSDDAILSNMKGAHGEQLAN